MSGESSADLQLGLECGSAFEDQRGPQGAAKALDLLGRIKDSSSTRENGERRLSAARCDALDAVAFTLVFVWREKIGGRLSALRIEP